MTKLIREKSFLPVTKPIGKVDEAVIIIHADSEIQTVEDLQAGIKVSITDAPDVNMVGSIMLESADIYPSDFSTVNCSNNITIAKNVMKGDSDIGFMLADSFDELSSLVKKQLKLLIRSKIDLLHHTFLISPKLSHQFSAIQSAMQQLDKNESGQNLLKSLELEKWQALDNEEAEFMIDLIDTLQPE
jgi:phosphonate transport system substrate-binding protein